MFGDRHGDPCNIDFLKAVFSKQGNPYITGNRYDRNGIHIGRCNSCHQIRCPRATGRQTHSHPAGCSCIPVCRMRRTLFMGSQDMPDFITMLIESVVYI